MMHLVLGFVIAVAVGLTGTAAAATLFPRYC